MWFKNLSISKKLFVGFGMVTTLIVVLAMINYFQLTKINQAYSNAENATARNRALLELGWTYAKTRRIVASAVIGTGHADTLTTLKNRHDVEIAKADTLFNRYFKVLEAESTVDEATKDR